MIRKSEELYTITDEELDKITNTFYKKINKYISDKLVNDYVAYYIATAYKGNALWDVKFELTVKAAIEELAQIADDVYDIDKIKLILENKHKLKVIDENPTEIEEVK